MWNNLLMWSWLRPITFAQTVSLFFSFTWQNVLAWIVIVLGDFVINLLLINFHDRRECTNVIEKYLKPFSHCTYNLVTISDLVPKQTPLSLRNLSFMQLLQRTHLIKAYHVSLPTLQGRLPQEHKTYQMVGSQSLIFLTRHPQKMSGRAKFYLFHELGHANATHLFFVTQGYFAITYFALLIFNIHIRPDFSPSAIYVALAMLVVWAWYILKRKSPSKEVVEIVADQLALLFLNGNSDFRQTIAQIARDYRKKRHTDHFWQVRAKTLVQQAQRLSKSLKGQESSIEQWGPIMALSKLSLPPAFVSIPLMGSLMYISNQIVVTDGITLIVLAILWLVMPFAFYHFVVLPWTIEKKLQVLHFLVDRTESSVDKAQLMREYIF